MFCLLPFYDGLRGKCLYRGQIGICVNKNLAAARLEIFGGYQISVFKLAVIAGITVSNILLKKMPDPGAGKRMTTGDFGIIIGQRMNGARLYGRQEYEKMTKTPKPNEIYRHFKGNLYKVITLAEDSESGGMMVVYQALYGEYKVYVRPLSMFMSRVDKARYPDAGQEQRFALQTQILEEPEKPDTKVEEYFIQAEEPAAAPDVEENVSETAFLKQEEPEPGLDPRLLRFLEAGTYEEKLDILGSLHSDITDDMINTMAVALDVEVGEGELEERYAGLKTCLLTLEKYECNRLR